MLKLFAWLVNTTKPNMTVVRQNPVIFVIGCTGTGKSDLGVAIARKYNGEVISADSMQIYKGLDIATNKITEEETQGVPHHLMSFVDATTARYNIHQFRQQGLRTIEEIRSRGRIPIVVGELRITWKASYSKRI